MAVTLRANINGTQAYIEVLASGLTVGHRYSLIRFSDTPTLPRLWVPSANQILGLSSFAQTFIDVTAPYGTDLFYWLYDHTANKVAAKDDERVSLTWTVPFPQDPFNAANDQPIFRDPHNPYATFIKAPLVDLKQEWPVRSTRMSVIGSAVPRIVTDVRELKQGVFSIVTRDAETRDRLMDMFLPNRVIHMRADQVSSDVHKLDGYYDLFFTPLQISEQLILKARPEWRQWDVAFQQMPAPQKYWIGAISSSWSYDQVVAVQATYATLTSTVSDYLQMWKDPRAMDSPEVAEDDAIKPVPYHGSL